MVFWNKIGKGKGKGKGKEKGELREDIKEGGGGVKGSHRVRSTYRVITHRARSDKLDYLSHHTRGGKMIYTGLAKKMKSLE